ncbi:hypothetical protein Pint_13232 [Pistacia integerrima]|uniref:Uncharacterized protein n=1 Tax=Pistacia integerrima TaxID=434235 RepID=A0ACC0Y6M7_9ROSI|nr:hypothetical protein Pint_13232 [Pistacia integerrima]
MAACASKVLFVLALLFVSTYAESRGKTHNKEEDLFQELNNAGLNKKQKYSDGKALGKNTILKAKSERKLGENALPVELPAGVFNGKWELASTSSGVSAMHAILLPKTSKVLMYDATIWKQSTIELSPEQRPCRMVDEKTQEVDCFAHSVLFDPKTAQLRTLKLTTDTWCSSGGLSVNGNLVSSGGDKGGAPTVRYLESCDTCDWKEYPNSLADGRWYATQVTLDDGAFIVAGGREVYSYEYIPPPGQTNKIAIPFDFLKQTRDVIPGNEKEGEFVLENNLYPFLHLAPDGNVFFFANNRSVLLNPRTNQILREYPVLPGGSRSYPASGASALLPIKLDPVNTNNVKVEVLICGGAPHDAYKVTDMIKKRPFPFALKDCGRMDITARDPVWEKEEMPSPRTMADMLNLPNNDMLIINGAERGCSGWNDATDPNFTPVLYSPSAPNGKRFKELAKTDIPRMYHSVATVLPDGKILVAGSNTNNGYVFKPQAEFPTELRVEKFYPPYLDPSLDAMRPEIVLELSNQTVAYNGQILITFGLNQEGILKKDIQVTMYSPAFTTHGINMNQRQIDVGILEVRDNIADKRLHTVIATAPPSGAIAPPGYYLTSVVYKGVPSSLSMWLQIK